MNRLAIGLVVLRLFLALHLVQWGILQFVYTAAAIDVYVRWYGLTPATIVVDGFGLILISAGAMMAAGFGRKIAYPVGVLFQGAMVAGLIPHLLDPYGFHQPPNWINHGLIAQVPVLTGFIALYLLRSADQLSADWAIRKGGDLDPAALQQLDPGDPAASRALLLIRLAAALFFLQWGIEKFVETEMAKGTLERWYGVSAYQELTTFAVGAFQIVLALALATGTFRRLTYATAALVKLKTCWAIAALLLFPFATESGGRLTTVGASIPTLGTLWFLYWARAWDTISVDAKRRTGGLSPSVSA